MAHSHESDESGATLVLVALMMVLLLGAAALAVDLGYAYSVKRQLSSTADAAALAGAQEAGLKFKELNGCTTELRTAINGAVAATHNANYPQGVSSAPVPSVVCNNDRITVTVNEASSLNTFFGRVLGVSTLQPTATATAELFGSPTQPNLRPFTVCLDEARDAYTEWKAWVAANRPPTPPPGLTTRQVHYGNHNGTPDGTCNPTGTPGTWGYAIFDDIDGVAPTYAIQPSQQNLLCLIVNGYGPACGGDPAGFNVGQELGPPVPSAGYTGNSLQPSNTAELNTMMAQPVLIPVSGPVWTGSGSNARYQGFGAIPIKICGWSIPRGGGGPNRFDEVAFNHGPSFDGTNCWSQPLYDAQIVNWDQTSLVIQWQMSDPWVSSFVGQSATVTCDLREGPCSGVAALIR
jgi:Flp pilus assembly protein TadG